MFKDLEHWRTVWEAGLKALEGDGEPATKKRAVEAVEEETKMFMKVGRAPPPLTDHQTHNVAAAHITTG